jgi:1-deoxy-D-xylulose-5-phosphate reductoisomerase
MGPKISCDSATLMNKGLEVIEAHHLFGLDYGQIEVVVHPGSVVHSLAEFWDGSMLAQLGPADMRLALAYALSGPERWPLLDGAPELAAGPESPKSQACQKNSHSPTGLPDYRSAELPAQLLFEAPDRRTFKALRLAEEAGRAGGTAPATLNGANEEAVAAFLAERLSFLGVADVVEECLQKTPVRPLGSVDEALAADGQARILARTLIERRS